MVNTSQPRVPTGIMGLDEVLCGGLVDRRGYLVRGRSGTGKTTLGMHFLIEGVRLGESALFITLGESASDLKQNAAAIGLDTAHVEFLDLSPRSSFFADTESYDLFAAAEVERDPVTQKIIACVEQVRPRRVFLDSTSHLRYLSIDAHQFRKQLVSFIRFLLEQSAIVLYTSEGNSAVPDDDVMFVSDGVINLALTPTGRTLNVSKMRGSDFRIGDHTLRLTARGARVFPRLVASEHGRTFDPEQVKSGVAAIDDLLHGGLERGTVTILTGPAGVGKSTLALQFASEGARAGDRTAYFSFEESRDSMVHRASTIGIPLRAMLDSGTLAIYCVEPLALAADEIADLIRAEVEQNGIRTVVIDGLAGYRLSVTGEDFVPRLRAVFKYLSNMGVTTMVINETETITGDFRATEVGVSYMADNIVFLRYLELRGQMRKAIGILKKRLGDFERNLREFAITADGIAVGAPMINLRGILTGLPEWTHELDPSQLLE